MAAVIEIIYEGLVQTSRTQNVFYYYNAASSTPMTLAEVVDFANAFQAVMGPAYATVCSTDANFFNVHAQELFTAGGEGLPIDVAIVNPGTVAVDSLPASVACVMKRSTLVSSRRTRGRIYIPGIPEDALDTASGRWTAAFLASVNTAFQAMLTSVMTGTGSWVPIIFARANPTVVDKTILVARVNEVPRNQRRRQPDRGL